MDVKRILFPTDLSNVTDGALSLATSLARDNGATLIIVHVEELPIAYGVGEMYFDALGPTRQKLRTMLEAILPSDPTVACEHHLIPGEPASAIVDFAKEKNIDLIVMGTHGRTGLKRVLMGSIAEAVVRSAPCPVLSYKPLAKKPMKRRVKKAVT
jgi:universal stress protein A